MTSVVSHENCLNSTSATLVAPRLRDRLLGSRMTNRGSSNLHTIYGLTTTGVGVSIVSFCVKALPVVQFSGALVGTLASVIALILGLKKLFGGKNDKDQTDR
jgi:hypothetical protein